MNGVSRVAVIGLGAMGSRMARRLLAAGHRVVVWNRTAAKAAPLTEQGASAAASPAEAARETEAVITMVADPAALQEVSEGSDGIAAGVGPSMTVLQMSTVGSEATRRLASVLPAGTGMLDAPVLGSLAEAEAGSLRIFVGGEAELVERWTPVLSTLGSPMHVGPLGAGSVAKLVANSTLFGVLAALGEALALAERSGLSREVAFDVLAATPLGPQAERRRPSIESGEYPSRFALDLALKDAELVLDEAARAGVDLRVGEAARTWLADAQRAGGGARDYSSVLDSILRSGRPR